jgi:acyl transferase domain-containing protein/ubiquinone/menaquinone biosynthesis C-methylase UbiE
VHGVGDEDGMSALSDDLDIAIIGMSGRFPGARNIDEFWRNLVAGVESIQALDERELREAGVSAEALADPNYVRVSSRIEGVEWFDAEFFGYNPREAARIDPQQRLLLEAGWETLEDAGYHSSAGRAIGVFATTSTSTYLLNNLHGSFDFREFILSSGNLQPVLGNGGDFPATRLSYKLNLTGPSLSIQTACSSSLVAVHMARQSLLSGECDMALAGGASVYLPQNQGYRFEEGMILSPDGHCRVFDARAQGTVFGRGVGMVLLKPLAAALEDGDHIYATIKGSAINNDGAMKAGFTAPSAIGQAAVISEALANSGIGPDAIGYVEAHGTGTRQGDPIEIAGLTQAYRQGTERRGYCAIGSVKSNIGHLDVASGIASLIKTALTLERGQLAPSLHYERANTEIDFAASPFFVNASLRPWPRGGEPRRAGVSSFGMGGTNAHVILEEAPALSPRVEKMARPIHLLTLSARKEKALHDSARRYANHLAEHPQAEIADVCFTANTGRVHFDHRLAIRAGSAADLLTQLQGVAAGEKQSSVFQGKASRSEPVRLAFLFTGQGAQYAGMGRQLYETQPSFRETLDRCAELLKPHLNELLLDVLFSSAAGDSRLHQTGCTQPAMFAVEYALYQLLKSWGIAPSAVLGHSVGEYVAACVAGVFSLEDGLRLIAARGRLMQGMAAGGAMAAILTGPQQVQEAIAGWGDRISIAARNGPRNTVISGDEQAVEEVVERLRAAGVDSQRLEVSHAFHSARMEPMLDQFEGIAEGIQYRRPQMAMVSNLTGRMVEGEEVCQARYWRRQVREAVRFGEGMEALVRQGYRTFVEVGPHPVLVGMGKQSVGEAGCCWAGTLRRGRGEWEELLATVGSLYVQGVGIDWEAFDRDYSRRRLRLPTYPFQRERYWIERKARGTSSAADGWSSALEHASRQAQQVPIDLELNRFSRKWEALEELTEARIVQALRTFGLFLSAGERHSIEDALEVSGVARSYGSLVARWLERMVRRGILIRQDTHYVSSEALPKPALAAALEKARQALTDAPALWEYVSRCCASLDAVLRGASSPLDTLFPDGSFDTAEFLYQTWALPRYFNGILRSGLESIAHSAAGRGRPLRVLELGAGTGGTTASALPALAGTDAEYWFTDLSDLFLARAQRKFSGYPFVRYRPFDLDRDAAEQGVPEHSFEVVVAANVLHATRDLGATLERVKSLLASGGVLLAYEVTEHLPWFDITVALIEGWQKHADEIRSEHPLLKSDAWTKVLVEHGFQAAEAFPKPGSPAEILGHHVLLARGPEIDRPSTGFGAPGVAVDNRLVREARPERAESAAFQLRLAELPASDRLEALVTFVRSHVCEVLRLDLSKAPARTHRLIDLGVDSLMAVELARRMGAGLGLEKRLSSTLIFDYPTIQDIASFLEGLAVPRQVTAAITRDANPGTRLPQGFADRIAELSDQEAEALLLAKLKEIG